MKEDEEKGARLGVGQVTGSSSIPIDCPVSAGMGGNRFNHKTADVPTVRAANVQNLTDRRFARAFGRQVPMAHAQNSVTIAAIAIGGLSAIGGTASDKAKFPIERLAGW
ncbi:MAG TPA: hypothetical protein VFP63_07505 [Dehalococcoidia bacterium]|nr:hypothetical protein [Dehalococcoidia bacterium]